MCSSQEIERQFHLATEFLKRLEVVKTLRQQGLSAYKAFEQMMAAEGGEFPVVLRRALYEYAMTTPVLPVGVSQPAAPPLTPSVPSEPVEETGQTGKKALTPVTNTSEEHEHLSLADESPVLSSVKESKQGNVVGQDGSQVPALFHLVLPGGLAVDISLEHFAQLFEAVAKTFLQAQQKGV